MGNLKLKFDEIINQKNKNNKEFFPIEWNMNKKYLII
jgi:hypothetical protein